MPTPANRPKILFVHGMFMKGESWEDWVSYFEERGFDCEAPDWPHREGTPAALRASPPTELRELTLTAVVDHFAAIIQRSEEPVYLVGHSMGGLVVQLLLQRGLGLGGVAIDSAPPNGISSFKWSFIRSNIAVVMPSKAPINPSVNWFRYAFTHTLPETEVAAAYKRFVVPESRLVGKGPTLKESTIDFEKSRAPLLMIAGREDHIIPFDLNQRNAEAYGQAAPTDFRIFEGRTHWIVAQPGWEEVAAYTEGWLQELIAPSP